MNNQSPSSIVFNSVQKNFSLQTTKSCCEYQSSTNRQNFLVVLRIGLLLLLLPLFFSCVSVNVVKMVPDATEYGMHHPVTVALTVEDGKKKGSGLYSGTIKSSEFKEAIQESLGKVKLFKSLVSKEMADYLLKVKLTYAGSHSGFNMHAWVNAQWSVIDNNLEKTVWSKLVRGKGHATVSEAFAGAKRQLMALERGAKANIDEAFEEIGKLNLSPPEQ